MGRRPAHPDASGPAGGYERDLFVEWYGGGVAVSHRDDQPFLLWHLLSATFPLTDDLPIRFTRAAMAHPSAPVVFRDLVHEAIMVLARRGGRGRLLIGEVAFDGELDDGAHTGGDLLDRLRAVASEPLAALAVVRIAAPPAFLSVGWQRETSRLYRAGEPRAAVAEALPAGILLRPSLAYSAGAVAVFAPTDPTIIIGTPGRAVPLGLVAMLRRVLLDAPAEPSPPRLEIVGDVDEVTAQRIADLAEEMRTGPHRPNSEVAEVVTAAAFVDDSDGRAFGMAPDGLRAWPPPDPDTSWSRPSAADHGFPAGVDGAGLEPGPGPIARRGPSTLDSPHTSPSPPVVSARPVVRPSPASVSGATPLAAARPPAAGPRPTTSAPSAAFSPPVVTIVDPDRDSPSAVVVPAGTISGEAVDPPLIQVDESAAGQPAPPAGPRWRPVTTEAVADRASTEEEQHRFAAALGSRFTDLLAVVNAAMATWPVLREVSAAGKADFVAVCLYLGTSSMGAAQLNEALRLGGPVNVDAYVPCLISGLRQLPLHRRPVLSQARLEQPAAALYPVGSVKTEPAPITASVSGEVTVPEADVDFLIWPRTARQASVLVTGNDIDEVVFGPGRRLRVLAIHSGHSEPAASGPPAPSTAVLLRELSPDEQPTGVELDDADHVALSRLEPMLEQRRSSRLRSIDNPDLAARLVGPPPGYMLAGAVGGWAGGT